MDGISGRVREKKKKMNPCLSIYVQRKNKKEKGKARNVKKWQKKGKK